MRWHRNASVVWRSTESFLALGTVRNGAIVVGGPGAEVWAAVAEPITIDEVVSILEHRFEPTDSMRSDVESMLEQLHRAGYVDRI